VTVYTYGTQHATSVMATEARESVAKHCIGALHALMWILIFPLFLADRVHVVLGVSTLYYVQDIVWSIAMGQISIVAHHIAIIAYWLLLMRTDVVSRTENGFLLLCKPMLFMELSAAAIHMKHIFHTSAAAHHLCMISYLYLRLVAFPIVVLPFHYAAMLDSAPEDMVYLFSGFFLSIFVLIFSAAAVYVKASSFRRTIVVLSSKCRSRRDDKTKRMLMYPSALSSQILWSSTLSGISSIVALSRALHEYAAVCAVVFLTSVNHWRSPRKRSMRRYLDLIAVYASIGHHIYASRRDLGQLPETYAAGLLMCLCMYACAISNGLKGRHERAAGWHSAMHLLGLWMNIALYAEVSM